MWPTLLDAAGVRGDTSGDFSGGRSLLRGAPLPAIAGTNRDWGGPRRFVVDDGRGKAELTLSEPDAPGKPQELELIALRDERDAPTDEDATESNYVERLRARFGATLDRWFIVDW